MIAMGTSCEAYVQMRLQKNPNKQKVWVITQCRLSHDNCMSVQSSLSINMTVKVLEVNKIATGTTSLNSVTSSIKSIVGIDTN